MHKSVAVIVPTLDEEPYLARSLPALARYRDATSAIHTTLIVVDGGSGDATAALAARHVDVLVTPAIDPRAAQTIAAARNAGADRADAEILFHTDADVMHGDVGRFLARALDAFEDPEVVAYATPVHPYPWEATRRDHLIHVAVNAFLRLSFAAGAYFARGECQVVRTAAFRAAGGYREDLGCGEDGDLFRRLAAHGRIVWDQGNVVHHSPRRFRKLGYLRVAAVYVREALWLAVFDRSFTKKWPVVR